MKTKVQISAAKARDKWRKANPDKHKASNREAHINAAMRYRRAVYDHYGWSCALCGFDHPDALSIDHIDQNGSKHLRPNGRRYGGAELRRWLVKEGFPPGFRVLCFNCQMIEYAKHSRGVK